MVADGLLRKIGAECSTVPPLNMPLVNNNASECLETLTVSLSQVFGATDHWLRLRNFPPLRRCGRRDTSRKAYTVCKQPQFQDRSRCYAHWPRMLRHFSPLWSLVNRVLLEFHVQYKTLTWRHCRWLRTFFVCSQKRGLMFVHHVLAVGDGSFLVLLGTCAKMCDHDVVCRSSRHTQHRSSA